MLCFFGTIHAKAQDSILVKTENVLEEYKCFCPKTKDRELIRSMQEAKAGLHVSYKHACINTSIDALDINFGKYDFILLDLVTAGQHPIIYSTVLYKLPKLKKYIFLAKIKRDKDWILKVGAFFSIRELAPKLEPGYSFEYKVEEVEVTK